MAAPKEFALLVPDPLLDPRAARPGAPARWAAVALAAMMLAAFSAAPAAVQAASQAMVPACSGVNLRSSPSTSAAEGFRC